MFSKYKIGCIWLPQGICKTCYIKIYKLNKEKRIEGHKGKRRVRSSREKEGSREREWTLNSIEQEGAGSRRE